jgi:uncharacterized protein YndB with AHSA1/START domain
MEARSDGLILELKRAFPASPPLIFAALSEASELAKWWGPEGFAVPSLTFQARVGGRHRIEMQGPFKTEARRAVHRDGWTESFDRLERLTGPA